jgi:hypothetical protein
MPDQRDAQHVADEDEKDEIDEESAIVLPNREAMSIIDPTFLSRLAPTDGEPVTPDKVLPEDDPTGGV